MIQNHSRVAAIDGLRAVAVIGVIFYHLNSTWIPSGFIGVDIFFVISGYVVSLSILKSRAASPLALLVSFYAKRLLRIFPALIVMLLATCVATRLLVSEAPILGDTYSTGGWAFLGLSNILLSKPTNAYFGPTAEFNPFLHTWSLGVEEQFYLVIPVIIYCITNRSKRMGFILLVCLTAMSVGLARWYTIHQPSFAYYSVLTRFWELSTGVLLAHAHASNYLKLKSTIWNTIISSCGWMSLIAGAIYTDLNAFPFPWAILPVLGTTLMLISIASASDTRSSKFLSLPIVVWIGRASYSLYLWHWPVIVLMRWTIGVDAFLLQLLALLGSFIAGAVSYHFVEVPTQVFRWLTIPNATVLLKAPFTTTMQRARLLLPAPVVMIAVVCSLTLVSMITYRFVRYSTQIPLSTTMQLPLESNPWQLHCGDLKSREISTGDKGLRWSNKRLFVIGDSHAYAYCEMLYKLKTDQGVNVYLDSTPGVRICHLVKPHHGGSRASEAKAIDQMLQLAQEDDIVLFTSLRVLRFVEQWCTFDIPATISLRDSPQAELDRKQAVIEGKTLVAKLIDSRLNVIIEAPKPVLLSPPFRCSDWFNCINPIGKRGLEMNRRFLLDHRIPAMKSIAELKASFPDVVVWDPFPTLCPTESSHAFVDGKPLFFDGDHLTGFSNQILYQSFVDFLGHIWQTE